MWSCTHIPGKSSGLEVRSRSHSSMTEVHEPINVNGAFTVAAGGAAGLTPNQLRSGRFNAPTRGARVLADSRDIGLARVSPILLAASPDVTICDVTGAHVWGLPLPPWIGLRMDEQPVSAAGRSRAGRPQTVGVRGRRLAMPPDHIVEHRGLRLSTPERTWLGEEATQSAICSARVARSRSVGRIAGGVHRQSASGAWRPASTGMQSRHRRFG